MKLDTFICCSQGVPLAPSEILKVLMVSKKAVREQRRLLYIWNDCKVNLLQTSQSLKGQRGKTFWGKVLASKVSAFISRQACIIRLHCFAKAGV